MAGAVRKSTGTAVAGSSLFWRGPGGATPAPNPDAQQLLPVFQYLPHVFEQRAWTPDEKEALKDAMQQIVQVGPWETSAGADMRILPSHPQGAAWMVFRPRTSPHTATCSCCLFLSGPLELPLFPFSWSRSGEQMMIRKDTACPSVQEEETSRRLDEIMCSSAAVSGDAIPAAMEEAARLKYGSEGMSRTM